MTVHVCENGDVVTIEPGFTKVVLMSGAVITGAPQNNPEQAATARELGYGDDVAGMVEDHDPLHAMLCSWLGLESFTLREVAGELSDDLAVLAAIEEEAVVAVQKFMRLAGGRLPLKPHCNDPETLPPR